ncbi:hypothetical protein TNCV_3722351 [Trichonephila clavipes]|nr:hypothetical protein TNCV_3722351 [Trichonephila clavipes]
MFASGSSVIPTPLAHANNQGEGHPHLGAQLNSIYMTPRKKAEQKKQWAQSAQAGITSDQERFTTVESQQDIDMKIQGELVRARSSREKQYSPYIKKQRRSGSEDTRRRGSQQQNGQERKGGVKTNRSISLEVVVGDVN